MDLCGHATLGAAYVLFHHENHPGDIIHFQSARSGQLTVTRKQDYLTLNFPVDQFEEVDMTADIRDCFDLQPVAAFKGKTDYLLVFDNESEIATIQPRPDKIANLNARGVIITARGNEVDFVSRFFAPQVGVNEDPVTGSAHTTLTPYWAKQLGKNNLNAIQLSSRKGYLQCLLKEDRVEICGKGRLYLKGEIYTD